MPKSFASSIVDAGLRDGTLTLVAGGLRREIPWPREPLTPPTLESRTALVSALREWVPTSAWRSKPRFRCSLPAQGIVVRTVQVPRAAGPELRRLLRLQVEAAFPMPPSDLAWGTVDPAGIPPSGPSAAKGPLQSFQVAAVRRSALQAISAAVTEAGWVPEFTLSTVVRDTALLAGFTGCRFDVGLRGTDVSHWENGRLVRLRSSTAGLSERASLAEFLTQAVRELPAGSRVSVGAALEASALAGLTSHLPDPGRIELRPAVSAEADAAPLATLGDAAPLLRLMLDEEDATPASGSRRRIPMAARPWLARAAALAATLLLLPYVEALIQRPRLQRQLVGLGKDLGRLAEIDRRLEFLQHIADNQPPYFDATYVVANAAPQGTRIDGFTMNRKGEVSLNGFVPQAQQVGEFRGRLLESRFFSAVVVEEQSTPQPGGRANFRISAQWKPAAEREALQLGPEPPPPPSTHGAAGTNAAASRSNSVTQPGTPARP